MTKGDWKKVQVRNTKWIEVQIRLALGPSKARLFHHYRTKDKQKLVKADNKTNRMSLKKTKFKSGLFG